MAREQSAGARDTTPVEHLPAELLVDALSLDERRPEHADHQRNQGTCRNAADVVKLLVDRPPRHAFDALQDLDANQTPADSESAVLDSRT